MTRSYYSNTISDFLKDDETRILGQLSLHHNHALEDLQKNAWVKQITILKDTLQTINNGQIYFEFSIPRMGKRVDKTKRQMRVSKTGFTSRYSTRFSLKEIKEMFNNDAWEMIIYNQNKITTYKPHRKTIRAINTVRDRVFVLM